MEIRIPEVGESIQEALLAKWFKKSGDLVQKDEPLCEIETDKITLDVNADVAGILTVLVAEGATVAIGAVIGTIAEHTGTVYATSVSSTPVAHKDDIKATVSSPSIRREMRKQGVDPESVSGTGRGGRITLDDLFTRIEEKARPISPISIESLAQAPVSPPLSSQPHSTKEPKSAQAPAQPGSRDSVHSEEDPSYGARREERKPISPIRKRISERMVSVRQQTAMLTTFNEVDMTNVNILRDKFRDHFKIIHGAPLGLMPFFVKACVEALKEFPAVNASIDGDDFVYYHYFDIGIAIGAKKGLVVPIIRDADTMKFFQIDQAILDYKEKIASNRISISDLTGGTFTISNGGVYGSMLSTPILNPPQSAVLGMHVIQERPVARDGHVVIRPMMYLALSYDHRIIDGREAVGFLKKVKVYIEEPVELLLEV